MRPLRDIVVVEISTGEVKTSGGLIMPATSGNEMMQRMSTQGVVAAIGPEVRTVKVGDIVVFDRNKATLVSQREKDLLLMKEKVVLGILPPNT